MPKPFANSAQITYSLVNGDWLLGIQTGNSTGDAGLPQMKHIKLSQLSDWVRGTYGQIWRYRGPFSASLPSDPQFNDYFLATATFTVDSVTYTKDHLYAYNASGTWDDISDMLSQYASQAQVTDIDDRLTVVEVKVDAMGDGIVYKGEVATYADLAGIVDPQRGWEYYVTADAAFYVYNGASWDPIDNGVVQTITDGDTAHAPSGDAVYDALAAEAAARTAADSNLKDAIQANSNRISNLEEKADPTGAYKTVYYRGTNAVPSGKAEYAMVESIVGKSRAWNQMLHDGNFPDSSTAWIGAGYYSTTRTIADGVMTLYGASGNVDVAQNLSIPLIAGHKYLVCVTALRDRQGSVSVRVAGNEGNVTKTFADISSTFKVCADIITSEYNEVTIQLFATVLTNTLQIKDFFLRDLTLIFPEGVPSTVAKCVASCPSILDYDAYGYPIVNTTVSGVRGISRNIWNQQWEQGYYNTTTGAKISSTSNIRNVDKIAVSPSTSYDLGSTIRSYNSSSISITVLYLDSSENVLGSDTIYSNFGASSFVKTTPNNCVYINFYLSSGYGGTYKAKDICINVSDSLNGTFTDYFTDTLSLPSPVTLRSAGSGVNEVHDTLDPETGKIIRRVERRAYASGDESDATVTTDGSTYTNAPIADTEDTPISPVNPMIATEGGGTINTIQTQTPVIDNSMDVGYLAL